MSEAALKFIDEAPTPPPADDDAWTVLVVDDEAEIHVVTGLALEGMHFANRRLNFLHAFSGTEAKAMLREHPEIVLVLLDVVMESDQAGLEVVEFVRNELKNPFVRIILRTGQPGQAPELDVITRYDINDYRHKTELTRERLYTTVFTAMSTYRDLTALDANRRGLRKVIESTASLFDIDSMERFAEGVLEQLIALLFLRRDALMLHATGVAAEDSGSTLAVIAGTGRYAGLSGQDATKVLPAPILQRIEASRTGPDMVFGNDYFLRRQVDSVSGEWVFYVAAEMPLGEPDRELIELYCRNVSLARRHLLLRQQCRAA